MRIVTVSFYDMVSHVWTDRERSELEAAHIVGSILEWDEEGKAKFWYSELVVNLDAMPSMPFRIVKHHWNSKADHQPLGLDLHMEWREPMVNTKCNVIVPGFGLLAITETKVVTDCCTDALNEMLKDGWRMVAVCPQPDQRRPDYVLGRSLDTRISLGESS